ncbi:MAG TPA: fumarylacetoacetate hydrolase, partial [Alphaproteobacteria bacterium]
GFSIDDVRRMEVALAVEGDDQFTLRGKSSMREISRDPADLVHQTLADNHDYPDGVLLYLGTMFAPTKDRDKPGEGFTHKLGDIVTISTPKLGALVNRVNHCDKIAPHRFGVAALMHNLAARGLL